jgi:DNA-binding MarR family transcriptional regulator
MIGKRFTDTFAETKRIMSLLNWRAMASLGLGCAQAALLRELGRSGPTTQSALARAAVIDPSAAARAFTLLDRRGWTRRRKGKLDLRESYVELTPLGKKLLRQVEARHAAIADLVESRLDAHDLADLERICRKLESLAGDEQAVSHQRERRVGKRNAANGSRAG